MISPTPGLGGLGDLGSWWSEPIVFQKAVVWTMLWEILGLGAGSLPLTLRFKPMIGGVLYWSRPGHHAAAALARARSADPGDDPHAPRRRALRGVLFWLGYLLFSRGVTDSTALAGRLDPGAVATLLSCSPCSACATRCPSWRRGRRSTGP